MRNFKLNFCAFLLVVSITTIGAQNEDNPWLFSVGLSAVDFYPTDAHSISFNDFETFEIFDEFFNVKDHWNVGLPYLSIGRYLAKDVSFGLTGTHNRIKKWGSE